MLDIKKRRTEMPGTAHLLAAGSSRLLGFQQMMAWFIPAARTGQIAKRHSIHSLIDEFQAVGQMLADINALG
jgi:hypothetical protein